MLGLIRAPVAEAGEIDVVVVRRHRPHPDEDVLLDDHVADKVHLVLNPAERTDAAVVQGHDAAPENRAVRDLAPFAHGRQVTDEDIVAETRIGVQHDVRADDRLVADRHRSERGPDRTGRGRGGNRHPADHGPVEDDAAAADRDAGVDRRPAAEEGARPEFRAVRDCRSGRQLVELDGLELCNHLLHRHDRRQ